MNILVTGANGQLGTCIKHLVDAMGNGHANHTSDEANYYYFADHSTLDITDESAVKNFICDNFINVVINCAAYTNVDKAEDDWDKAFDVNVMGPKNLAAACALNGAVLIHVSTDYVFDGEDNAKYKPSFEKNPQTNYGLTKSRGEEAIKLYGNNHYLIIRTAWLYSEYGKNFVKTINSKLSEGAELKVVNDQVGSPTYAMDLADFILYIIENNNAYNRFLSRAGIWHFANKGIASWYDLAKEIELCRNKTEKNGTVTPCDTSEFPRPAKRPKYSVLNVSSVERDFGYEIRDWKDALHDCITKLNNEN